MKRSVQRNAARRKLQAAREDCRDRLIAKLRLHQMLNEQSEALAKARRDVPFTTDPLPIYRRVPLPESAKDWYGTKGL